MSFRYTDVHRDEYFGQGFTVLRGLIPPNLLTDLRRQTDVARQLARDKFGPQTQRLQPVYEYDELDHQPFWDFLALPELRRTVDGILGPEHRQSEIMGVLLEPAEKPWAMHWHRDWRDNLDGIDREAFSRAMQNLQMFNQLNAALWDDHSLWVVPFSHNREDTEDEVSAFPSMPPPPPELSDGQSAEERELTCSSYVRQMPGAVPVALLAGDCAFYRACQWHVGTYVPYTKRGTLHDGFYGPDDLAWQRSVRG